MVNEFRLTRNQIARIVGNDPEAIRAFEQLVSIAKTMIYTDAEKTKLAGIEAGAQVNVPTDLSYNAASRLLSSSTGTDVTLPLASTSNAGLGPARSGDAGQFLNGAGVYSTPSGAYVSPLWSQLA